MMTIIIGLKHTDSSHQEVASIKRWADDNLMKLNMKKTYEMVVKGKIRMPLPESVDGIAKKSKLKLLGVTVNEDPCNWDTQFENMLSKASSRLYILRVCKYYGYSLQELTLLFDSLIMSLFTYAIEVWACAYYSKYLSQIDRFCKLLIVLIPFLNCFHPRDQEALGKGDTLTSCHVSELNVINAIL